MRDDLGAGLITFLLDGQVFGLEMQPISEVLAIPEITILGNSTSFDAKGVKGIFDLRGTIVPVIDLKIPLGIRSSPLCLTNKIIVVNHNGVLFGLIVDSLGSVVELAREQVSSAPEVDCGIPRKYIVNVARLAGELIVILNIDEILAPSQGAIAVVENVRTATIS